MPLSRYFPESRLFWQRRPWMQSGGTNGAGAYAVAKGALHIFTRTLARELGPAVRANAICPRVIETAHHVGRTPPEKLGEYRQSSLLKHTDRMG